MRKNNSQRTVEEKKNTLDLTPFSDVCLPRAQNRRSSEKERLVEISGERTDVCQRALSQRHKTAAIFGAKDGMMCPG